MNVLNDVDIRPALISWLNKKNIHPISIFSELTIADGQARPDIVALYSFTHCFEIKGENDRIERVVKQASYYHTTFKKNTLITTQKHLAKALKILPEFWGIILVSSLRDQIIFKYIRKASYNTKYNVQMAAKILWKIELQSLLQKKNIHYNNRHTRIHLISLIEKNYISSEFDQYVCKFLLERKSL